MSVSTQRIRCIFTLLNFSDEKENMKGTPKCPGTDGATDTAPVLHFWHFS